ncbi:MAG: hypothetical protein V3U86_02350 [Acidobacteriota bacterium]
MKRSILTILVLSIAGLSSSALADLMVKREVTADQIPIPGMSIEKTEPCAEPIKHASTGDIVTLYAAEDRLRREQGDLVIILRRDSKTLYLVHPPRQEYSEIKFPLTAKKSTDMVGSDRKMYELQSSEGPEIFSVQDWIGRKYSATLVNKLQFNYRVSYVLTDVYFEHGPIFMTLQKAIHQLRFGRYSWIGLLPQLEGLPLVWEEAFLLRSGEVLYREEAVSLEEVEPMAGRYEVDPLFQKVDYNPACFELR